MSSIRNSPEPAQLAHSGGPRPAGERGHSASGSEQRDLVPRGCGVAAAEGQFAPSHTWAAVASSMNGAGLAAPPRPKGGSRPRSSPVPAGPKGRQGRRASCGLVVVARGPEERVGLLRRGRRVRHTKVSERRNRVFLTRLGSANGTLLDGVTRLYAPAHATHSLPGPAPSSNRSRSFRNRTHAA